MYPVTRSNDNYEPPSTGRQDKSPLLRPVCTPPRPHSFNAFHTPLRVEVEIIPPTGSDGSVSTTDSSTKSLFVVESESPQSTTRAKRSKSSNNGSPEGKSKWSSQKNTSMTRPRAVSESDTKPQGPPDFDVGRRRASVTETRRIQPLEEVREDDEGEITGEESIIIHTSSLNIDAPSFNPKSHITFNGGRRLNSNISMEFSNEDGKIQPIPALIGPSSLPYARCPSGIDAFYFGGGLDPETVHDFPEPDALDGYHTYAVQSDFPDPQKSWSQRRTSRERIVSSASSIVVDEVRPTYPAPPGGHIAFAQSRARQRSAFGAAAEEAKERRREATQVRKELERVGAEVRRDISMSGRLEQNGSSRMTGFKSASDALKAERHITSPFLATEMQKKAASSNIGLHSTLEEEQNFERSVASKQELHLPSQFQLPSPHVDTSAALLHQTDDAFHTSVGRLSPTMINPLFNPFLNPGVLQVMMEQAQAHGVWSFTLPIIQPSFRHPAGIHSPELNSVSFLPRAVSEPLGSLHFANQGAEHQALSTFNNKAIDPMQDPAIIAYGVGHVHRPGLEGLGLGKPPIERQAHIEGRVVSNQSDAENKYRPPHKKNQENVNIFESANPAQKSTITQSTVLPYKPANASKPLRESPMKKNWRNATTRKSSIPDVSHRNGSIVFGSSESAMTTHHPQPTHSKGANAPMEPLQESPNHEKKSGKVRGKGKSAQA